MSVSIQISNKNNQVKDNMCGLLFLVFHFTFLYSLFFVFQIYKKEWSMWFGFWDMNEGVRTMKDVRLECTDTDSETTKDPLFQLFCIWKIKLNYSILFLICVLKIELPLFPPLDKVFCINQYKFSLLQRGSPSISISISMAMCVFLVLSTVSVSQFFKKVLHKITPFVLA